MVITTEGAVTVWNLTVMELTVTGSVTALYRTMSLSSTAAQPRKAPAAAAATDSTGGSSSTKAKGMHAYAAWV
jgi:hypothetical protein